MALIPSKVINYRALTGPRGYDPRLRPPPTAIRIQAIPIITTMLASLIAPLFPTISMAPTMPPWGLLMLLSWRLLDRDIWPVWMALPLGFFDDLFSGQPLGSAMMLWGLAFLVIEVFDRRMIWRDYREDWGIAAGLIAAVLTGGLIISHAMGGNTPWIYILPQIMIAILCFPIMVRFCAMIDRARRGI